MRPKKKTRKKRGHRQELTRLMIDSISLNGKVLASEEKSPVEEPQSSVIEVTSKTTETVTKSTTGPTVAIETVETQLSEATAEVETVSKEKVEN